MYSLVVPVFKNEGSIKDLLETIALMQSRLSQPLEVVFVVDGSPDRCFSLLNSALFDQPFSSQLILLSRNFGSFAAIRAGLECATGSFFAVMAADLQEPPELIVKFFEKLSEGSIDVVVGVRDGRADPFLTAISSKIFWYFYRAFIQKEMPRGGVDMFGCNKLFRDHLVALSESNSSIVGLMFWLGFRRHSITYRREARRYGKSAWTFKKKVRYLADSIFSFSDLPIRLLIFFGFIGLVASFLLSIVVLVARLVGEIRVPGYAPTILLISFFAALNCLGLGIIGSYVWRAFENTKGRPSSIVLTHLNFKERFK